MLLALSRENILADNFIAELPWKICRHQKPRRGGAGILPYAAVKPCVASASANSSFFSPLSLPLRSMM